MSLDDIDIGDVDEEHPEYLTEDEVISLLQEDIESFIRGDVDALSTLDKLEPHNRGLIERILFEYIHGVMENSESRFIEINSADEEHIRYDVTTTGIDDMRLSWIPPHLRSRGDNR